VVQGIIRPALRTLFGDAVSKDVRVLYGGSVNGRNAEEFFAEPEIDGALVGGASLKVADFIQIVQTAAT
jgi:triosephosphate isomerase